MKLHIGLLAIPLVGMLAGCAGLSPKSGAANEWTAPLAKLGISGDVTTFAAPRDWRVHVVSTGESLAGRQEVTLADLTGPGAILNFQAGNPTGTLKISVDDGPAVRVRFENLFGGFVPPFTSPLAGVSRTGAYSYVPIPFAHRCVITLLDAEAPPVCQITYAEFRPDTPVIPFSVDVRGADKNYFRQWKDGFDNAAKIRMVDRSSEKLHQASDIIWPHKDNHLYALEGAGVITEIEMEIGAKDPGILRNVWIELYWDGQKDPGVAAPLASFFGAESLASADFTTPAFGKKGQRLWCRLPMPYAAGAELRLVNGSNIKLDFAYSLTWRPGSAQGGQYFHARYNVAEADAPMPIQTATIQGRGHLLGQRVAAEADGNYRFAAANVTVTADGEPLALAGAPARAAHPGDAAFLAAGLVPGGITSAGTAIGAATPFLQSVTTDLTALVSEVPAKASVSCVTFWYQTEPGGASWPLPDQGKVAGR